MLSDPICSGARRAGLGTFVLALMAVGLSTPLFAQSLESALTSALDIDPSLKASEAAEDAAQADVDSARAGFLPSLVGRFSYGHTYQKNHTDGDTTKQSATGYSYGVEATLPLFRGGRTVNSLRAARAQAEAAKFDTFDKAQQIALQTADAYLSVMRDRRIIALRSQNVAAIAGIRNGEEVRFRLGEATKTDIALARLQLELTRADEIRARGDLQKSELRFEKLTGHSAGNLVKPNNIRGVLPKSAAEVRERTALRNPKARAAQSRAQAAIYDARVTRGELFPSVDLTASYDWRHDLLNGTERQEEGYLGVSVNVPIFQPKVYPAIRRARALEHKAEYEAQDAALGVQLAADLAWAEYLTAAARLTQLEARFTAARAAEYGTSREYKAGARTITDLLDARERTLGAEIDIALAEYDYAYAGFVLLATIGELGEPAHEQDANFSSEY